MGVKLKLRLQFLFIICVIGECIKKSWVCDGEKDCNNGEDELNCCNANTEFTCNDGFKCIKKSWLCDGDNDCDGGEDEHNARCPNAIRSHDWVGLDNRCHCDEGPDCFISTGADGGWSFMRDKLLSNEKFKIITSSRKKNAAIKDGDTIGLYWGKGDGGKSLWFSCNCGGYCKGRTCPGLVVSMYEF